MPAPRPPLDTCDNDAHDGGCLFEEEVLTLSSSCLAEPLPDADDGDLLPLSDDGSFSIATDVGSSGKRKKDSLRPKNLRREKDSDSTDATSWGLTGGSPEEHSEMSVTAPST